MTEYRITHLGFQGDGVAAGPVFAPRALPNEVVTGEKDGNRLRDVKIVRPSSDRIKPRCRHFNACGGCDLQHASDALVATWKADVIAAHLAEVGITTDIKPTMTTPEASRRRATFAARRTKKGTIVGFHGRASGTIVEIPDCQVLRPELLDVVPMMRDLVECGASRKATLDVQVTATENGPDVHVTGGKPLDRSLQETLAQAAETFDVARLSWEDELIALRRPPAQSFKGVLVSPPPGAFLQATKEAEVTLQDAVIAAVAGATRIVDLFSGCGTFALPLAATAEVTAVETDDKMLKALDHGWRHAEGLRKVRASTRDLFRRPLLPEELRSFDAAVIDPPRAGAEGQTDALAASGIETVAFVSCNPVTFARDAKLLTNAGFTLDWVLPVDQFRWTPHIELVGQFTRGHIAV